MAKIKSINIFCENLEKEVTIDSYEFYYEEGMELLDNEIRCAVRCPCGEDHDMLITYL